jgi:hypothetical protein
VPATTINLLLRSFPISVDMRSDSAKSIPQNSLIAGIICILKAWKMTKKIDRLAAQSCSRLVRPFDFSPPAALKSYGYSILLDGEIGKYIH